MSTEDKDLSKVMRNERSRFRGVYPCGESRWKAQLQRQGVQYYLGIYNTEIEAALAYDKKAREDGSGSMLLTNFNEDGTESLNNIMQSTAKKSANKYAPSSKPINPSALPNAPDANENGEIINRKKRKKPNTESISRRNDCNEGDFSKIMVLENPNYANWVCKHALRSSKRLFNAERAKHNNNMYEFNNNRTSHPETEEVETLDGDDVRILRIKVIHFQDSMERVAAQGFANAAAAAGAGATGTVTTAPV